jgi:hypothetical protein
MNSASLSNARSSLSNKLKSSSHFLCLIPFNEYELEALADSILSENAQSHTSPSFINKIMKAHFISAKLLEKERYSFSERESVTLREFLRVKQFHESCPQFSEDVLIELVYGTQFKPSSSAELLKEF